MTMDQEGNGPVLHTLRDEHEVTIDQTFQITNYKNLA